jgi:hypothetical protein
MTVPPESGHLELYDGVLATRLMAPIIAMHDSDSHRRLALRGAMIEKMNRIFPNK